MAFIQYKRNVDWDATLSDLGFCDLVVSGITQSLVVTANKTTTGVPAATTGYFTPGCLITNLVSGVIYSNTGSTASPVWTPVETGSPLTLPTAEIFIGNGSNVPTPQPVTGDISLTQAGLSTVTKLRGVIYNTLLATPFTNEIIQYSGNSGVGWVNSALKAGTAVSGAVSFTSTQYGTNTIITTDSLTTVAGSTYSLTVTDGQLTSTSNYIGLSVTQGTATAGQMVVEKLVKTGGAVTMTIKNIDPTAAANGTFLVSYLAV